MLCGPALRRVFATSAWLTGIGHVCNANIKNPKKFLNNHSFFLQGNFPLWYYEMQELGYNYRLTDFQAALGLTQLSKAVDGIKKRRQIAKVYHNFFKTKRWIKNQSGLIEGHAYHLYIIEVEKRDELYNYLREMGIFCQIHYFPLHLMPYYASEKKVVLENSEDYIKGCISLPMFPTLTEDNHRRVLNAISNFYES